MTFKCSTNTFLNLATELNSISIVPPIVLSEALCSRTNSWKNSAPVIFSYYKTYRSRFPPSQDCTVQRGCVAEFIWLLYTRNSDYRTISLCYLENGLDEV